MFQISVHNNSMEIVDYISNSVPDSLHFYNDKLEIFLYEASATFEFTVDKFKDGQLQDRIKFLNDDGYLSMTYDGDDYLFIIRKIVEDDYSITVYGETLNLDLLNEQVGSYDNEKEITFEEALNDMGIMSGARLEMGINEISTIYRIVKMDSEETVLARILSLASYFGGEIQFVTKLYPNGELDTIIMNVYKRRTNENPGDGIGNDRKDVRLYFGRDVEGVRREINKESLFNALRIKDKDGKAFRFKNEHRKDTIDGLPEVIVKPNSNMVLAPISMRKYPSVVKKDNCDNWTIREKTIDSTDENVIWEQALDIIQQYMYPQITYDITLHSYKVLSRYGLKIGDTIYVNDENFIDYLIVQARVVKMSLSETNPLQNKIELANFVTIQSQVSEGLLSQMKQMAKDATPYTLNVSTDNGVSFKEYKGTSTITPLLFQGKDAIRSDVTYIYYMNGTFVHTGPTFTVSPQIFTDDRCVVNVEAIYKNNAVANVELTFFNVNDGESPILTHIETSSGNIFKNGTIATTLTARLWRGEEEIDIEGAAFEYIWRKIHDDGTPDEDWNRNHLVSQKSITISNVDVFRRSTFQCDVTPIY